MTRNDPFSRPSPDREVRGWQLLQYAIDRDFVETVLTIANVEHPREHPEAPPGAFAFLRFQQIADVFMVNQATYSKLIGAFGPRFTFWIGKYIRIIPVEHKDQGGEPVWTLEVEPLWRCANCQKEFTSEYPDGICAWCAYEQRQRELHNERQKTNRTEEAGRQERLPDPDTDQ